MNEKQIIKLIGASIFAVLFLWGVYVFSGYYSQWQEKKAQQEQHAREQMAEQYMSSYTEKLQKTLEKAGLEGVEVLYQYDKYWGSTPEYDEYGREIEDDEDEDNRKDPETERIVRNVGKGRSGAFIILFKENSLE